ncbi:MAG: hypothetical protein HOP17_06925 [Acidobacteria bacterium]|nr:hypothetical protein [Acidobacteriota bacterium]
MSKHHNLLISAATIVFAIMILPIVGFGQYLAAEIMLDEQKRTAVVEGRFSDPKSRKNFSFAGAVIGLPDPAARISELVLFDEQGKRLASRRFASNEYVAENGISAFSYRIDLRPGADARSAAHASWLGADMGVLMLDDVLPLPTVNEDPQASIAFKIPASWKIVSSDAGRGEGIYAVNNVSRAVFIAGKDLRENTGTPAVAIGGSWHFTDVEAGGFVSNIYAEYKRIFGGEPATMPTVALIPFPQANVPPGTWEAETRGSTVLLLSADTAFKGQSLQRLHEQLRHELFHLWLPNGVNLAGRYDWFYEGFALYQSLKTAVAMNQIGFDDFLDTLSRARNIDSSQTRRRSLLELSQNRLAGGETHLYARGMVAAFLCDLAILQASNRKDSVESVFRKLFDSHKFTAAAVDGKEVVLKALARYPATDPVVNDLVRGDKTINWSVLITAAGLEDEASGISRSRLRIKQKPDGRQRALLDKLGYNSWRKLTRK